MNQFLKESLRCFIIIIMLLFFVAADGTADVAVVDD
jgi:hypothetical protein